MQLKNFATVDYWFSIDRIMLHRGDSVVLIAGFAGLALAALLYGAGRFAATPVDRRLRTRLATPLLTFGVLEVLWFAARYQLVRFFGSKSVAALILVACGAWFAVRLVRELKRYRADRAAYEKEQVKLKYLPHS
jgi:uncharacterized membrane protein SpoIIM required for sporulation